MPLLTAYAAELDALASRLGRCSPGSRDVEAVYAEWDEIRREMTALSSRMRAGVPPKAGNDGGGPLPALVITGRGQVLAVSTRRPQ